MAIGPADDYLIHQLPVPVAQTTGERNFYDRHWCNGYSSGGEHFFACSMGVYPQLGIADAAFSVICGDWQYSLRASRHLGADRSESRVGPIEIDILEPLRSMRLRVSDEERGFAADLTFSGRFEPMEEPRHQRWLANRILLDSTRMTQLGHWTGELEVKGERWKLEQEPGTRDRSWGIRPVGKADSQPAPLKELPQFHWLWVPAHLDSSAIVLYRNDDAQGVHWNRGGGIQSDQGLRPLEDVRFEVAYRPGGRRVGSCTVTAGLADGRGVRLGVQPGRLFYMTGTGYMHPEWGHGMDRGGMAVTEDAWDLNQPDQQIPPWLHVQAFSRVQLEVEGERPDTGIGVLEQLLLGPHAPSGFQGLMDPVV